MVKLKLILVGLGGIISSFLGGFDIMLVALITFMLVDYITGVMNAIVKKELSSTIGFKGIFGKITILFLVGVSTYLDIILGSDMIRYLVICFYLANEGISLLENASCLGLPIPERIKAVLEQLKSGEK